MKHTVAFLWLVAVFFSFGSPVEAQTSESVSALQNYRIGRDLEARNRRADADVYYNEAIRICNDEVARNVATNETYTVITWTLFRQTKYSEAITWGDRGLRLYPNEYRLVETVGEAWFHVGDYRRSLSFLQRFTNAVPQGERSSIAFFYTAEIYRLTEKYRHADIAYTTALRLSPEMSLWWYRLGTVREETGDRALAIEAYQRAVRLDPNYQIAVNALARLQAQ